MILASGQTRIKIGIRAFFAADIGGFIGVTARISKPGFGQRGGCCSPILNEQIDDKSYRTGPVSSVQMRAVATRPSYLFEGGFM